MAGLSIKDITDCAVSRMKNKRAVPTLYPYLNPGNTPFRLKVSLMTEDGSLEETSFFILTRVRLFSIVERPTALKSKKTSS